jgi:hypothetical protein
MRRCNASQEAEETPEQGLREEQDLLEDNRPPLLRGGRYFFEANNRFGCAIHLMNCILTTEESPKTAK